MKLTNRKEVKLFSNNTGRSSQQQKNGQVLNINNLYKGK